jgi:hypothetical protein
MLKTAGGLAMTALATVTLAGQSVPRSTPPQTSAKAVTTLASNYLDEYTTKLEAVVADETYFQETFASVGVRTASRMIKGELNLAFLPADRTWIAARDVIEVDGQPVPDRGALASLLLRSNLHSVLGEVMRNNSRFNIGRLTRTFSEPTLALLVLDRSRIANFSFKREQVVTERGATLVTVSFAEGKQGTIVRSLAGSPIRSKGELVIDAATGHVHATRMMFKSDETTADIATAYMLEPKLQLWVPSVFAEHYEGIPEGLKEIVTGSAQYTNYRRWESFGRIKKDGPR